MSTEQRTICPKCGFPSQGPRVRPHNCAARQAHPENYGGTTPSPRPAAISGSQEHKKDATTDETGVLAPGHSRELAVIDAEPLVLMEPGIGQQFSQARRLLAAAKTSMAVSAACMILAGVELLRLHKLHGVKRGGDRRSADQTRNDSGLKWPELVKRELGIGDDTARNYMAMAEAARKRVPELNSEWLLGTPLLDMPEMQREELLAKVQKVTDGQTARQLMWDWGIAKKPHGSGATGGAREKKGETTYDPNAAIEVARDLLLIPLRAVAARWTEQEDKAPLWTHLPHAELREIDGLLLDLRNDLRAALKKEAK